MLGTVLFCSVFWGQQLGVIPKSDIKLPAPLTAEFQMDTNERGGTSYFLKATFEYIDIGPGEDFYDCCINDCNGYKHINHEECDLSCDTKCQEKEHIVEFAPELDNIMEKSGGSQRLADIGSKFAPDQCADQFAFHALNVAEIPILAEPEYTMRNVWPCWNTTPCSDSERGVGSRRIRIQVSYEFSKEISGMRALGPTGKLNYATFNVPYAKDKFEEVYTECYCSYVQKMATFAMRPNKTDLFGGVRLGEEPFAPIIPATTLDKYGFKITCEDMNYCEVTSGNPTGMPLKICVNPGTMLVSSDPSTQDMLVTKKITLDIPAWATASVTVPLGDGIEPAQGNPTAKGGVVCLNMSRKEPTKETKFKAVNAPSLRLKKLADFASRERIIGPWVQTRFWIVTDHATLPEVQKMMALLKPTEGHYLRALNEAATLCRIDMTKGDYKKCMNPNLLVGGSAPAKATKWFIDTLAKSDPDALVGWLTKNHEAFAPLFAADAQDYAIKHVADVANALCMSTNPEVRAAGHDFLLRTVPEAKRPDLAKANGFDGLTQTLVYGDEKSVTQALDTAEALKSKAVFFGLVNLSPKASADQKARATTLATKLRG